MELKFSTVRERDMDLLFLEAISTDKDFADMIVGRTKWINTDYSVTSIELSRTDSEYGESDITVIIAAGGLNHGILIEDKIDAIAMPNQHKRYLERGAKGVSEDEYKDYDVIIVCPQKYYKNNDEAKLYEHHIFYEEFENYFKAKEDDTNKVRLLQIQAALNKAKKPPEVAFNEAANAFFVKYRDYQKCYYPHLDLRTSENSNGWWTKYSTMFGQAYIYHKMQEGFVDLTFPNAAKNLDTVEFLAKWLRKNVRVTVTAKPTGKAAALRIEVPQLKVKEPFGQTSEESLKKCFEAISTLSELASIFNYANKLL